VSKTKLPFQKHIGLNRQLTRHVTTRWYRAPELILIQPYSSAVDIWSIGCIFAELLSMQKEVVPVFENRSPLFPGKTCYPLSSDRSPSSSSDKMDQLIAIFEVLGMPSDEDIQSVSSASKYIQSINVSSRRPLESIYQNADKAALDLLNKMLQFNPNKRITAAEALDHEFLRMIRRPDMEVCGDKPFVSPAFLNSDILSIEEIKRKIAEEIDLHKQMSLE
jgi:mitogen-activated protein kinase 1/3